MSSTRVPVTRNRVKPAPSVDRCLSRDRGFEPIKDSSPTNAAQSQATERTLTRDLGFDPANDSGPTVSPQADQGAPETTAPALAVDKPVNAAAPVAQRAKRVAQVQWERTHVVKEIDGSIFGGEDSLEGEIPGRELTAGQKIIVEDADIFVSRRGANQEDESIRDQQSRDEPSRVWFRVLVIEDEDLSSQNVYVRAETIAVQYRDIIKDVAAVGTPVRDPFVLFGERYLTLNQARFM